LWHITTAWRQFFGDIPSPIAADPNVGKSVSMFIPYTNTAGTPSMHSGPVTITGQCPSDSDNYLIQFTAGGGTRSASWSKEDIITALADSNLVAMMATPIHSPPPIQWSSAPSGGTQFGHGLSKTDNIFKLLSVGPKSALVAADGSLEATEVLTCMKAFASHRFGAISFSSPSDSTHDDTLMQAMASCLATVKPKLETPEALARAWPSDPAALGVALLAFTRAPPSGAPPPAPRFPLTASLESKAMSPAEFQTFLQTSFVISTPPSAHPLGAGATDSYLRSSLEARLTLITKSEKINDLAGGIDSGTMTSIVLTWSNDFDRVTADKAAAQERVDNAAAIAKAVASAVPDRQHINVQLADAKAQTTSESEQRQMVQLRLDAEHIVSTPTAAQAIEKLIKIKGLDDDELFNTAIAAISDQAILRLMHSDLDVSKALGGGFESIAQNVVACRSVLERRLETAVLGERSSQTNRSDRLVRAMRYVRRGNTLENSPGQNTRIRDLHFADVALSS
jgi:hypothetical protein